MHKMLVYSASMIKCAVRIMNNRIRKKLQRFVSILCCLSVGSISPVLIAADVKPNVVLILVDDLGWQDVKCYDIDKPSPMETPNLDALAKKGVQFWQAYSPAPVCAPSRAAILSGLHPARGEMTSVAGGFPPHAGHPHSTMISPYYSARMPTARYTLAEAMKANGYVTAHSGKWHISKHHYDYPTPYYHGFDESTHHRGVQSGMQPDRLTGFATTDPKDPFRLDENGMPFDVPQDAALNFIKNHKEEPFFLYYATWLVHTPIVMRSEALLRKYEKKLGVTLKPEHAKGWDIPGQTNPFYCAMVEQLDYYMGQLFDYLEQTDDPRRPGHKLIENTYIIFTSDNGGMEGGHGEIITDNYPLDRGKISLREGGTRVPLIITGPDIPQGVQSEVMANGLDFYPTILSLIGAQPPAEKHLDGYDLKPLLTKDPTDASLVRDANGVVRDTMFWHFPQMENTSSIRVGDYKLLRDYKSVPAKVMLNKLYDTSRGENLRGDIEEAHDLAAEMPEKAAKLEAKLDALIRESGGRIPYFNPLSPANLPNQQHAPVIAAHSQSGDEVRFTYQNRGAEVVYADLIYSPNNGREWLKESAEVVDSSTVRATLPDGTTHYFLNLVDEHNFLAIYPEIDRQKMNQQKLQFSDVAVFAGFPEPVRGQPFNRKLRYQQLIQPTEGQRLLVNANFENETWAGLNVSGEAGLLISDDKSTGGKVLRIEEVDSLGRDWMPLVSAPIRIPSDVKEGIYRISLDLKADAQAPGVVHLSVKHDRDITGKVSFGPDCVKVGEQNMAELEPGLWYHLNIDAQFGASRDRLLSVKLSAEDGRIWEMKVPYSNYHFDQPNELQIIGLGQPGTAVEIDNVVIIASESSE